MEITYDDFKKVQIKVGTVLEVKVNEKARKPSLVVKVCLLYTSPSPRDRTRSRMPSSA